MSWKVMRDSWAKSPYHSIAGVGKEEHYAARQALALEEIARNNQRAQSRETRTAYRQPSEQVWLRNGQPDPQPVVRQTSALALFIGSILMMLAGAMLVLLFLVVMT